MDRKRFTVTVTRPLGYVYTYNNTYPLYYSYAEGMIAGDDKVQDAYVLLETENSNLLPVK